MHIDLIGYTLSCRPMTGHWIGSLYCTVSVVNSTFKVLQSRHVRLRGFVRQTAKLRTASEGANLSKFRHKRNLADRSTGLLGLFLFHIALLMSNRSRLDIY